MHELQGPTSVSNLCPKPIVGSACLRVQKWQAEGANSLASGVTCKIRALLQLEYQGHPVSFGNACLCMWFVHCLLYGLIRLAEIRFRHNGLRIRQIRLSVWCSWSYIAVMAPWLPLFMRWFDSRPDLGELRRESTVLSLLLLRLLLLLNDVVPVAEG